MSRLDYLKMEQAEAKQDGAKPVKNSGRGIVKGDATLDGIVVDYKYAGKSFTLNKSVWAKICADAATHRHSSPALKLIVGEEGTPKTRLWVIDDGLFHEMYDLWREENYGAHLPSQS